MLCDILQRHDAFCSMEGRLNKPCKPNSTVVITNAEVRVEGRKLLFKSIGSQELSIPNVTQPVMSGCCAPPGCSPACTYGKASLRAAYSTPSRGACDALAAKSPRAAEEPAMPLKPSTTSCVSTNSPTTRYVHDTTLYFSALKSSCAGKASVPGSNPSSHPVQLSSNQT